MKTTEDRMHRHVRDGRVVQTPERVVRREIDDIRSQRLSNSRGIRTTSYDSMVPFAPTHKRVSA